MPYHYSLHARSAECLDGWTISDTSLLEACYAAGLSEHIIRIRTLQRWGIAYSGEDHDTLSAAWSALGWPKLDYDTTAA